MTVTVIKKHSQSFAVRVGIVAILVLTILGLGVRILKQHRRISVGASSQASGFADFKTLSDTLLVPVIELEIQDPTQEKNWIAALAARLSGQSEVTVPYGRVDVLTGTYAIEVDYLHKWKEGIGQSLHYASVKGITPCLALIYERTQNQTDNSLNDELAHIEALCSSKGIRLLLLKQK